jgi:antirestriction protein
MHIDEYESIYKLNELAAAIEDSDIIAAYLEAVSDDLKEALENADKCILYSECETLEDLAAELVDEGFFGNIPDSIKNYIDYSAIARDLGFEGYTETTYGVLYHG